MKREPAGVRADLDAIFNPRNVAVLGASSGMHRFGARRFRSLIEGGFIGAVYPIHPTAPEVQGHRTYTRLKEVPEPIDLAVVMLRSELVPGVVAECAALRIPGVVVLSGGFGETGVAGQEQEQKLVAALRSGGGRMVGTNCAGLFSRSGHLNIIGWRSVPSGSIALVSQSGNMARTFAQRARADGSGFSKIITIGNVADLKPVDYIEYLFSDPDTNVIVAYVEGFGPGEGRALYTLLAEHPNRKPVVIVKPGVTEAGRKAALSHTGSLAGEERIVDAALRQCGALRFHDTAEAWAAAVALAQLPRMKCSGVAVASDGGGHATVVADTVAREHLSLSPLAPETQAAIAQLLPPRSTCSNPVDFAGKAEEDPSIIPPAIGHCLADEAIGGVILAGHFGGYFKDRTEETERMETAAANELASLFRKHGKPFILHTVYGADRELRTLHALREAGVPIFDSLENSAKAMAAVWRESSRRAPARVSPASDKPDRAKLDPILAQAQGDPPRLAEPEARALLAAYGIPVPDHRVVRTMPDARVAARELGMPLVLKLASGDVVHKSDVGGVILGLQDEAAVADAFERLMEKGRALGASDLRVLMTRMCDGVEMAVGAFRDEQFGPIVMCGWGGVYIEVLGDVAFRVAPVARDDALEMIRELRASRILGSFRGREAADIAALAEMVARMSQLLIDLPEVKELDLNPVFVRADGVAIADARIVLN